MLEVNEFLVLDFVREHERTTRSDIGHALELSAATVSRIVARLLRAGLVNESGVISTAAGRPRTVISFNQRAGSVIAIDLGGTKCHAALADLAGNVLCEDVRPTHDQGEPYRTLVAAIGRLRAEAARRDLPVTALAVGVPAVVDPDTGRATAGPNVDWGGFDLVGRLRRDVDVPFVVENDVNLAALAQAWRGDCRGVVDFIILSIGTGIGAAVVANGQLVKGRHNAAGEIGYLVFDRDRLHRRRTGELGTFEGLASGPSIVRRAEELLEEPSQRERSTLRAGTVTAPTVVQAAQAADPVGRAVIDEVLDYVAITVVAMAGTVDPERIVLDGGVGRSLEPFLGELVERVQPHLPTVPAFSVSRLGPNSTVVGAIATALQLARQQAAPSALFGAFSVTGHPA